MPATPRPLDIWVAGAPQDYRSNPFAVTYSGQAPGSVIPASYVPVPGGHVQLALGESDEIEVQVTSRVPADLVYQVQVAYRVADQPDVHTLTLPDSVQVVFSDASNWHVYALENGHLIASQ